MGRATIQAVEELESTRVWGRISSQGTKMRAPPSKFAAKARSAPARDETITFWGNGCNVLNTTWGVVDLIHMAVET
eukprot:12909634-Prorocentrum_lima.AAC.1